MAGRRASCRSAWASTPARASWPRTATTSASTSIGRPASRAAGHGGQVLVSDTTRVADRGSLPPGVTLRDLGEHRLKDLSRSERIGQLVIAGLPDHFPPLRTLDATPNNLPVLPTSFVGRVHEVAEARRLLATTRLLTLTGPGGTGKTRLALQVAAESIEDFPDGVFFVPLEPIVDPALVAPAIARGARRARGRDRPSPSASSEFLALAPDPPGARQLRAGRRRGRPARLTCSRPDRTCALVATSRSLLHVYGEQEYPVPPLGVPDPANLPALDAMTQYEAVALFIARAMAAKPDFAVTNENAPAVAAITARLDGLPLAIELAAARVKLLNPQAMLPRLESRLALLAAGLADLPARQQTLRGAIDWSYGLLDEPQRCLFARASVFSGGFDLEAAEAICGPRLRDGASLDVLGGLGDLADQSLVRQVEEHDHVRFRMLETIREFAIERLVERGESDELRRRHAAWFTDLIERAAPFLTGQDRALWLDADRARPRQRAHRTGLGVGDPRHGHRVAHRVVHLALLAEPRLPDRGSRCTLPPSWRCRPTASTRCSWCGATRLPAALRTGAGTSMPCREHYRTALELAREIGDQKLIADELYNFSFSYLDRGPRLRQRPTRRRRGRRASTASWATRPA